MESTPPNIIEQIQTLAARIIATHPAGYQLCLIGGFRYRLLDASGRASTDIDFLHQHALPVDAPARLARKLKEAALPPAAAIAQLGRLERDRAAHVRQLDRLLDEQVAPTATTNLRAAGGAAMLWDSVIQRLRALLTRAGEHSP
jgi:hypothetical protein